MRKKIVNSFIKHPGGRAYLFQARLRGGGV